MEMFGSGVKTVVGVKQTLKAIAQGKAAKVIIAQNASPHVTDEVRAQCVAQSIECQEVPSMQELGRACGIHVGAAAVTVLKA